MAANKVTADTITDEQIRNLRREKVIDAFTYHTALWGSYGKQAARARAAAILNARTTTGHATKKTSRLPRSKQKKTASQLDREIRESMLASDAEIDAFLETLDVTRDPEDQGMVDDAFSAIMGDDKARERLTAIIRKS